MVVIKPFEFVWNRSSFPHCSLTLTLWGRLLLQRNKLTFFSFECKRDSNYSADFEDSESFLCCVCWPQNSSNVPPSKLFAC